MKKYWNAYILLIKWYKNGFVIVQKHSKLFKLLALSLPRKKPYIRAKFAQTHVLLMFMVTNNVLIICIHFIKYKNMPQIRTLQDSIKSYFAFSLICHKCLWNNHKNNSFISIETRQSIIWQTSPLTAWLSHDYFAFDLLLLSTYYNLPQPTHSNLLYCK